MKSVKERIKQFFSSVWSKIDTSTGWIAFTSSQLKWSIAFFVRICTITLSILLTLVIIKKLDIITTARSLILHDVLGIEEKDTTIVSSPDISYKKDLKSISGIIKMLERKGVQSKKTVKK